MHFLAQLPLLLLIEINGYLIVDFLES